MSSDFFERFNYIRGKCIIIRYNHRQDYHVSYLHSYQVVHRTLAALFTAFLSIATLAALNDRPTMHDVVNWIDSEALLLMFSMMTIVSVLMETGIFGYIAVYTFKVWDENAYIAHYMGISSRFHVGFRLLILDKQRQHFEINHYTMHCQCGHFNVPG